MDPKSHTAPLTSEQAKRLKDLLTERGWEFESKPYTIFAAKKDKTNVAVYEKGPKILVQGKGTGDFIRFILEPEILGEARLGYEEELQPEMFAPHFGIDESGKGDFFGPLVIAGAYVDRDIARAFRDAGIQDSKAISSDVRIRDLADVIRHTPGAVHNVVVIGPAKYNELYRKFGNLNRLLAWGHARVIENLLDARPEVPRALSDQFAHPALIRRALMEKGSRIELEQRTKAESDPAVAAASILARSAFIDWLDRNGRKLGRKLPRGASAEVKQVAAELVEAESAGLLEQVAKMHFKTAREVAPKYFDENA
jgi:ribonuclease HIII